MPSPFVQLSTTDTESLTRNNRDFITKTKFDLFTPSSQYATIVTKECYYQLYGALCYYHIMLTGATWGHDTESPALLGMPFGPKSVSGSKGTYKKAMFPVMRENGTPYHATYQYAQLAYLSGVPIMYLPNPGSAAAPAAATLEINGWFVRD